MSTLLWFILITAFMIFMHRGRGAHGSHGGMGCCGGGHSHGYRDYNSYDDNSNAETQQDYRSQAELASIKEAEYELIEEQPVDQINQATDTDRRHHTESKSKIRNE